MSARLDLGVGGIELIPQDDEGGPAGLGKSITRADTRALIETLVRAAPYPGR